MTISDSIKYTLILLTFLIIQSVLIIYATPLHDTLYYYQVFSVFYSDFFHNREILAWLPFSAYGVNAEWYLLGCMTIFKYVVVIFGSLIRISDTMLLFKLSLLLEESVFLLGILLLSRDIFKRQETIYFVSICAMGSIVLTNQAGINFYSYYLLPLSIYFMRRFFSERTLYFLPLAALTVFLSIPGQGMYFLVIFFIELTILFLALAIQHYQSWKEYCKVTVKEAGTALLFLICSITVLVSIMYLSFASLDNLKTLSTGRDIITKHTPLDVFLTYGGQTGFEKFTDFIFPAVLTAPGDQTLYIGLLALPMVLYAVIKVKDPLFRGISVVVIIMGLFSLGGYFSTFMYHAVPGMKYFRHIGLSIACFKLFLPLMAGYGLDHFLNNSNRIANNSIFIRCLGCGLLISGAISCYFASRGAPNAQTTAILYIIVAATVGSIFIIKNIFGIGLIIAVCIELTGYQVLVHAKFKSLIPYEQPQRYRITEPVAYSQNRTFSPENERSLTLMPYTQLLLGIPFAMYNFYYNFLQWDACINELRADFVNSHIATMINARGGNTKDLQIDVPMNNGSFLSMIGCNNPKLKITNNVLFAATKQESIQMLQLASGSEPPIIITGVPDTIRAQWSNNMENGDIHVTRFTFNTLEAEVFTSAQTGGWLYYADAWHPSWNALVNAKPAPVYPANIGFKAVFVPPGKSTVRFYFENTGGIKWSLYCIFISGIIFTLACLAAWLRIITGKNIRQLTEKPVSY